DQVLPVGLCSLPSYEFAGQPICNPETGQTLSFTLGPTDVLAVLVCTPPQSSYFSYDLLITTRITEEYPFYPGQNFGDTISHYSVNVSDEGVFDAPVLLLHG